MDIFALFSFFLQAKLPAGCIDVMSFFPPYGDADAFLFEYLDKRVLPIH